MDKEPPASSNSPAPEREIALPHLNPAELLARGLESVSAGSGRQRWVPPSLEDLARLLPQYRITALLGHGGMGAVYRGTQQSLDREVAIKLLPVELRADEQFVARFHREARLLARLHHPHIVTVYDFGQTVEGHFYFVMEYVDGTDLARVIRTGGLQPEKALEWTMQICEALQFAHGRGVVHRDIKPANILLNKEGVVKLADFGLARPDDEQMGSLTCSHVVMGTFDYMAPEQHYGQSDHRADIYALGATLYEMLTGVLPKGAFSPPSHRAAVDVRLDTVVIKAMQQEPEKRYQRVSEMRDDVDGIRKSAVHTPVASEPEPAPPQRETKTARTRKQHHSTQPATYAVAVFVGFMIVLVAFALREPSQPVASEPVNVSSGEEEAATPDPAPTPISALTPAAREVMPEGSQPQAPPAPGADTPAARTYLFRVHVFSLPSEEADKLLSRVDLTSDGSRMFAEMQKRVANKTAVLTASSRISAKADERALLDGSTYLELDSTFLPDGKLNVMLGMRLSTATLNAEASLSLGQCAYLGTLNVIAPPPPGSSLQTLLAFLTLQ